jgi:hypothetical protein
LAPANPTTGTKINCGASLFAEQVFPAGGALAFQEGETGTTSTYTVSATL